MLLLVLLEEYHQAYHDDQNDEVLVVEVVWGLLTSLSGRVIVNLSGFGRAGPRCPSAFNQLPCGGRL